MTNSSHSGVIAFERNQASPHTNPGTSQCGLAAVQETAQSQVPTLGYGVSYAIGNILLALCGTLIVAIMGAPVR